MFAECDKHYPSRSGQTSLATAVANITKPRTSHFFDLCTTSQIVLLQMTNCLAELAGSTDDETQWKHLNYQVGSLKLCPDS